LSLTHTKVTVSPAALAPLATPEDVHHIMQPDVHADPGACKSVNKVLARVGDKWTMRIVVVLRKGPRRFSEIKRLSGGISQRMLTLTLRGLERDGMVFRTAFPSIPPRVDYELTALGHSLSEPIDTLGRWAIANVPFIEAARIAFDARNPRTESDEATVAK
jgi:DNA-binding HxlR family transcriptional regulator